MPEVKNFRVYGEFKKGKFVYKFKKYVRALNEKQAIEIVYSTIGGNHKVNRKLIRIKQVEEIQPEEIEDPVLAYIAGVE